VEVTPHHGNIKDKQFGVPYMKQFDIVFNALDNVGEPTLPPSLFPCSPRRTLSGWLEAGEASRHAEGKSYDAAREPVIGLHGTGQMRGATSTEYASPLSARWSTAAPRATLGRSQPSARVKLLFT
jgi:hypothetical protein